MFPTKVSLPSKFTSFPPISQAVVTEKSWFSARFVVEEKPHDEIELVPFNYRTLIQFIMDKKISSANLLLKNYRGDLNETISRKGISALIAALSKLDITNTNALIQNNSVDVNLHSFEDADQGITDHYFPALIAVSYSFLEGLKLLLSRGDFNINEQTVRTGLSVLFYALQRGKLEIVNYLLDLKDLGVIKLNINIQKNDFATPLHIAVYKGFTGVVEKLLSFPDLDANLRASDGLSAVQIGVKYKKYELVEMLLNSGKVDIFQAGNGQDSAFKYVEKYGDPRIKAIFTHYIQEHFCIPYANSYSDKIKTLNERAVADERFIAVPEQIAEFHFLQQLLAKKPNIKLIQISMEPDLCTEDSEPKIFLARFTNSRVIIEIFDYSVYEKYMRIEQKCPVTKMPISTHFDFAEDKCHLLKKENLLSLESLLLQ